MENTSKKQEHEVYTLKPVPNVQKIDIKDVTCKRKEKSDVPPKGKFPPDILDMTPPPFPDLGKRAKDVFSKGFHFGLIKLDCKTSTSSGVQFNTGGVSDQEAGKVTGHLESKYSVKDYGVTFTEKWTTDNTLATEVSVADQGLKGLKGTLSINFSPEKGYQCGVAKVAFANDRVAINADADLKFDNQVVKGSAVVGHQGWVAGYQGAFDVQNTKLTKSNFALGFSTKDFVLHTQVEKAEKGEGEGEGEGGGEEGGEEAGGQIYSGSVFQKVTPQLDAGAVIEWAENGEKTSYGLACAYELDADTIVRAKIDNDIQLGLSYSQRLRDGITLTVCANIDGHSLDSGGNHKVGMALELEA